MNHLLRSCAGLWLLGLLGMCVVRLGLELDPHALPFRLAGALWILGGLGYTGFGVLGLVSERERDGGLRPTLRRIASSEADRE